MFGEAERETFMTDQDIAFFGAVGEEKGFFFQIPDGVFPIKVNRRKSLSAQGRAECQLFGGDEVLSLSLIHISEPTRPY